MPLFYPQSETTAFTEGNPFVSLLTAPLRALGNPALSYNLICLLAILLTAAGAYAFVWWLTRHRRAAVFAGLAYACNGGMIWHMPGHIHVIAPLFLPGIVGFFLAYEQDGAPWKAFACAACLLGQMLCCMYLGVVALVGLAALWIACRIPPRRASLRRDGVLAVALGAYLLIAFAYSAPYRCLAERIGQTRALGAAWLGSADLVEYFIPPRWPGRIQTLMGRWMASAISWPLRDENVEFYGYSVWLMAGAALAFSLCALWRRRARLVDRRLAALGVMAFAGFLFSLGPYLRIGPIETRIPLPFRWAYLWIPPFQFMRAVARFSILVDLGLVALAAAGLAQWRWFNPRRRWARYTIFAGLLAVLTFEFFPISAPAQRLWDPAPYQALRRHPELDSIASIPLDASAFLMDATARFPRSPSGFTSGIFNYHFETLRQMVEGFPDAPSLAILAALGVKGVVVYQESTLSQAAACPDLRELEAWKGGGLYQLTFSDTAATEAARWSLEAIPERPPLSSHFSFPPQSKTVVNIPLHRAAPDAVCQTSLPGTGLPLLQTRFVYVQASLRDPGVDYTLSRLYWITDRDNHWDEDKAVNAYWRADGKTRVLVYDLSTARSWKTEGNLTAVRVGLTGLPYPGQTGWVEEIRVGP
ncbi:MAG: hypothetical protein NTW86_13330 [Candidatus Sumerlaeota bacterium]|nr:hypothetical protein [Candidatus Sumerlaeota bacterium]